MTDIIEIDTLRLRLRAWCDNDFAHFAEMNADPEVMEYYPTPLSRQESDELASNFHARMQENKWGFWAVESKDSKQFIGFVGLNQPTYDLPFSPCIEIGWRLSRQYWGVGYASEAARAVVKLSFTTLALAEIVSFTSVLNHRSIHLMQTLGMHLSDMEFNHPKITPGHRLEKHCLYRLLKSDWHNSEQGAQVKAGESI